MKTRKKAQEEMFSPALAPIVLPEDYNYLGVFLTLACNLHCSYCINHFGERSHISQMLSGEEWLKGLNRIVPRPDLPVSLQGGEPTLHPDFYALVNGIRPDLNIDLLTNLELDPDMFMGEISSERLKREAPYASIRVSYHPETMNMVPLATRVLKLLDAGYSIGVWGILHPLWKDEIFRARDYFTTLGIDFRTKEFLGKHDGSMHGTFSNPEACKMYDRRKVECRTTELLIGPGGDVYRCHGDLYQGRDAIGHILDPCFAVESIFRSCENFGHCNPCDIKIKTNRLQNDGHTSVEIRFI